MRFFALLFAATLTASVVIISAQSRVAGDWMVSFDTPNGAREVTIAMKVDGDALSGTIVSEMGEVPFKGTAKGNTFNASFDVDTPNGSLTIALTGEVDGDAMKGTLDFGQGTGEFTGKRKS
jgi:hypothetical protein